MIMHFMLLLLEICWDYGLKQSALSWFLIACQLKTGQLVTVTPYLVKKQKQHIHYIEQYGIDLILGRNGFIWIGEHSEVKDDELMVDQANQSEGQVQNFTALETRKYICRTANAVRVLSNLGFNMTLEIIKETVNLSLSLNLDTHEMLSSEFRVLPGISSPMESDGDETQRMKGIDEIEIEIEIGEECQTWEQTVLFFYDFITIHDLKCPSLTVQWLLD